ncbi:MAG TPA: hypothetical protein VE991_06325 [Acidimicrobiales bacterium]|nr:hypothetical protein [Acidimicrobiales bacterium]
MALLATVTVSLVFEPVLALHVVFGLAFVALVVVHLGQRRRTSAILVRRIGRRELSGRVGRLALVDGVLALTTVVMLASGLWDWLAGHRSQVRWHALSGVLAAVLLVVHTARRARRLARSTVS